MAALLSVVCPGLGLLYAGKPGPAVVAVFAPLAVAGGLVILDAYNPSVLLSLVLVTSVLALLAFLGQAVWAVLTARSSGDTYQLSAYNRLWVYAAFVLLTALTTNAFAQTMRQAVLEPFRTSSGGMVPAILPGDAFYVVKVGRAGQWSRGDVVVFHAPSAATRESPPSVAGP